MVVITGVKKSYYFDVNTKRFDMNRVTYQKICTVPFKIDVSKYGGIDKVKSYFRSITGCESATAFAASNSSEVKKKSGYNSFNKKVQISLGRLKGYLRDR